MTPPRPTPAPLTTRAAAVQAANRQTLVRREQEAKVLRRAALTAKR